MLILVLSFLLFIPFLDGKQDCLHHQGTVKVQSREKYFNHVIFKAKMPTLVGNEHLSVHSFPQRPHLFHFRQKLYGPNQSELDIKVFLPSPDIVYRD